MDTCCFERYHFCALIFLWQGLEYVDLYTTDFLRLSILIIFMQGAVCTRYFVTTFLYTCSVPFFLFERNTHFYKCQCIKCALIWQICTDQCIMGSPVQICLSFALSFYVSSSLCVSVDDENKDTLYTFEQQTKKFTGNLGALLNISK